MRSAAVDILVPHPERCALEQLIGSHREAPTAAQFGDRPLSSAPQSRTFLVTLPGLGTNVVADRFGSPADWVAEQDTEVPKLTSRNRDKMQKRTSDGLHLYCADPDFGLVYVPEARRKPLVMLAHRRLIHLKGSKVHAHLSRYYWWPRMRSDVDKFVAECTECQLETAKRHRAHKMWRAMPLAMPRASWCFDLKGVVAARTGECEIGSAVCVSSRLLVLFAAQDRTAPMVRQKLLDHLVNKHGPPLRWRTDAAQELVGKS